MKVMVNITKAERAGKAASKKIYINFASRIAVAEGEAKKTLITEAHQLAIAAAQKISPNIDIKGVKNQLGSTIRMWRQNNPPSSEEKKKDDIVSEDGGGKGENIEDKINAPPKIPAEIQDYIDKQLKSYLEKPQEGEPKTINVPNTPMDPNIIHETSQRVSGKVSAQFEAVIEKIFLDDYRKALFSSWKSLVGYPGDLGDLIIEAFDLFFKIKGVDLELVSHTPLSVDKGRLKIA